MQQIVPQPDNVNLGPRRTEYVFRTVDDPLRVTFDVELNRAGVLRGHLGQVGGPELPFSSLISPQGELMDLVFRGAAVYFFC